MEYRRIEFSPPDVGEQEIQAVAAAIASGWITTGPRTKLLERRLAAYIGTGRTDVDCSDGEAWKNRVACLNSATAAEEMNLRLLGIRPGDEVIVPAYTYTATASAAIHCGAKVVFVDVQKDGDPVSHMPEMDYAALEAALTPRTKAVVCVDLGGIVCDYDRVFDIVEGRRDLFTPMQDDSDVLSALASRIQADIGRIPVVADCAHSLGARRVFRGEWKHCGAIADFTSFSFHAVKNFTTAEGGAAAWRSLPNVTDAEIYRMLQLLSLHGQSKDALAKTNSSSWEYDVIGPWYKCNMTDILAAVGLVQLDRYPKLLARRLEILKRYDAVCDRLGLSHLVHHTPVMDSCNHLCLVRVPGIGLAERGAIIERLASYGVSANVHFKPLPMMTAYRNLGARIEDYPNAFDYYRNVISLPFHSCLSDEDVDHVCRALEAAVAPYL